MDEMDQRVRQLEAERRRPMPRDFHNERRDLVIQVEAERDGITVRRANAMEAAK